MNAQTAFSSQQLAQNMGELRSVAAHFFDSIRVEDWDRHTEPNQSGWTLRETLAHVTAIAEGWHASVCNTLDARPVSYDGLIIRTDLRHFNEKSILDRQAIPPAVMVEKLLNLLAEIADQVAGLSNAQLNLSVPCPAYNRPLTIAEIVGCQMAHLGIVHGAQLANAVSAKPLWTYCSPALLNHMLTYLFHQVSHSYWVERGGNLRASINFYVSGVGGGRWHLTLAPDGGEGGAGWANSPALIVWSPNAHILCSIFAQQLRPLGAIFTGRLLGIGNLRLGFRLPGLVNPT